MKLPKELTTVTPLSKYLAMVAFIALPFVGFFLGMRYQEMVDFTKRQEIGASLSIFGSPSPTPLAIPTVDPSITANWKTYAFQYAPLSFRYPSKLLLEEEDPNYPPPFRGLILKTNESSLRIHPLQEPIGIGISVNSYFEPLLINGKQLIINGRPVEKALLVSRIDKEQSYLITLQYPNKNQGNFLVFATYEFNGGKINKEDTKLFDQILSTFKFTQ